MQNKLYSDLDFLSARAQLKKYRIVFYSIIGIYVAASLAVFFIYLSKPYKHKDIAIIKFIEYAITAIFIIVVYIFYSLKLKRVKVYCKILDYINIGLKEQNYGEFIRFNSSIEVKDGAEFKTIIMSEWNHKLQDYYDRKVLVDREKDFPNFKEGDKVEYLTQGNILIEYQIKEND